MAAERTTVIGDTRASKALPVAWLATHSRVLAVEFRHGDADPVIVRPPPGHMKVVSPQPFASGARVEVTVRYHGAPPGVLTGAAAESARSTTLDHFEARRKHADGTKDEFWPHRQLFLRLDEQTHTELESLWTFGPGDDASRRRGAIERLTNWLWGHVIRRGAAWAHDLDPRQPTWTGFDADVAYLSGLLLDLIGEDLELGVRAFEHFANGQLICPSNAEQGGPDGANFVLFAAFAAVASGNGSVPEQQRTRWLGLLPCLVGTLEVFAAGYRAPAGKRTGRSRDFAVDHRRPRPFDQSALEALRARYAAMTPRQLMAAFDRWVASMLTEDVSDLGS
jgi:hypothetical protein